MTIEGFDFGIGSMKKGEKAMFMFQAGYCIKPGNTQMDKFNPNSKEEREKTPKVYPDVPENLHREVFLKFEVNNALQK